MKSRLPQIEKQLPAAVNAALKDSADRIRKDAASRAPVRTGDLKASLLDPENSRPGVFRVGDRPAQGYGIYAQWYWFLVEFGHGAARPGRDKKGTGGAAPPHPFLIPAAERERPQMIADVKRALGNL